MNISEFFSNRHKQLCRANVCDVAMNGDLLTRFDEVVVANNLLLYSIQNLRTFPELVGKFDSVQFNIDSLLHSILQDCGSRPTRFTDIGYISFLADKIANIQLQNKHIAEFVSAHSDQIAPTLKKRKGSTCQA